MPWAPELHAEVEAEFAILGLTNWTATLWNFFAYWHRQTGPRGLVERLRHRESMRRARVQQLDRACEGCGAFIPVRPSGQGRQKQWCTQRCYLKHYFRKRRNHP